MKLIKMNSKLCRTKYTLPCCWIIWAVRKWQWLPAKAAVYCFRASHGRLCRGRTLVGDPELTITSTSCVQSLCTTSKCI